MAGGAERSVWPVARGEDEKLAERVAGLEARLEHSMEQNRRKDAVIIEQMERIKELERALEDARRGGKRQAAPFSKGDPKAEPKRPGRKSGRDHGRHGHRQPPELAPDHTFDAGLPGACPVCGGEVVQDRVEAQFQVDIPPVTPVVTKFNVAVGHCRGCGSRVQGHHPSQTSDALGAAASQVGPVAKGWGSWLHYGLGLPFAKCSQILARLGINVTAGAICSASARQASTELVTVHQELVARANASPTLTMDETGWRTGGWRSWLWEATNANLTVYWVADGRGFEDATVVIGADYSGVIVRDGWVVYDQYQVATHQSCLGHLLRRCHEMEADLPRPQRHIPAQAKAILKDALDARVLDQASRVEAASALVERIDELCAREPGHDANRRLLKHLSHQAPHLFTFLTADPALGVDATNWRAETGIRPAVVNRKVCGGNRTPRGARTQGRMMSVIRTAVQHGVDPVDYLASRARAPDPGLRLLLA